MQYDQYQTVFALSSLANWIGGRTGTAQTLQADYQQMLLATLASPAAQAAIGSWELVWGPQVWQGEDSELADNALYVAKASGVPGIEGDVYVVAICATNPSSLYDWLVEDFDVASVVNFTRYDPLRKAPPSSSMPWFSANIPYISMGTALGVWHLLQMVSPAAAKAPGTGLCDFLQAAASADATVIFAGHSLGGALSPTAAFWLKNAGKLDGYKAVYCYPTAGATPGNAAFAQAYAAALPSPPGASGYRTWNRDLWNTRDVVPHAWDMGMLSQIKTQLYGNAPITDIDLAVDVAIANAWASGIAYRQIANQPLPGTVNGDAPNDLSTFLLQVKFQHTEAYEALIANWLEPVVPSSHALQTAARDTQADALVARLQGEREARAARAAEARAALAAGGSAAPAA